ncbi:hypothetical protein JYK22_36755, partial [Nonomuraea sp. RK-328]|nr:hypothetical protein [Nonomuraea sp. RK-328]
MGSMLYNVVASLLSLLPALALITGVILTLRARRDHGRAAVIGTWGCLVLLTTLVLRIAWSMLVPTLVGEGGMDTFQIVMLLFNAVDALFTMTGLGLLVWAVVARRAPSGSGVHGPHAPGPHVPTPQAPAWQAPVPPPPGWQAPAPNQPHSPYGQEHR